MHRLPFALALLAALPACSAFGSEPLVEPGPDPADLRVRQTPNDTVRAGTTVTFTAVYADSLRSGDHVRWWFDSGRERREGRVVDWVPPVVPGTYLSTVTVRTLNDGLSTLLFRTVVVP